MADPTTIDGRKVTGGPAQPVVLMNQNLPGTDPTTAEDPTYTQIACGEIAGAASATQMPALVCKYIRFKAETDNAGNVYIGGAGVTKPDGASDWTTGFVLDAGDDTGWIPIDNLNRFYRICDNAGDDLTFLALVA